MTESGESPWAPEEGKAPSEFQTLQKEVDQLPGDRPLTSQERVLILSRDRFIDGHPELQSKVFSLIDKRIEAVIRKVAVSADPYAVISNTRETLAETGVLERQISGNPLIRGAWKSEIFAGVPTYYFHRALDRLEIALLENERVPVDQEIKDVVAPAGWEWHVPPDLQIAGRVEEIEESARKVAAEALSAGEETGRGTVEPRERRGKGYSNFVSNEGAQRPFYENWFLSSPPEWFGELPEKWKEVVRTRMFINNQAAIKRKDGPFELDPVLDNRDMRIDKEALITMWKEMPGFRQAFATMWHNFFEIHPSGFVEVKGTAFPLLKNFPKYKETLKEKIKNYIDLSNGLEGFKKGPNGSSLTMAEAAVASAWNLIYVSNVVDSGDLERNIKGEVVAEQVRTFFRPLRKGQSKWLRDSEMGEVIGTDESWGGQLGDWYAERCRHDTNFSKNVKEGRIRYIPTRLMYSWFDIQKIDGETLGAKLTKEVKRKVVVSDDQRKTSVLIEGLWDFDKGAKAIDFESLEGDNLWPGYADAADSARLIYKIIQGTAKDPEMRQVATAFSKLREVGRKNFKPLAQVYNDEQLIVGCILGMLGGPIHFSTELVVAMPDDKYDSTITRLLREDRLFTGFADPRAARRKIMELLHASDLDNPFNIFGQQLAGSFLGKRGRLRIAASLAASQKVGRF